VFEHGFGPLDKVIGVKRANLQINECQNGDGPNLREARPVIQTPDPVIG
jgi:hypothetical protein